MSTGTSLIPSEAPRDEYLLEALPIHRLDHYYDSVNRRADWKWVRAARILKDGDQMPSIQVDGAAGCQAIRHLLAFRKDSANTRGYADCRVLQTRYPAMYRAYEIYADRRTTARWTLEANLLTQRSYDEISVNLRLPLPVIDMYANIFFDIRDRLQNRGYIRDQIIQPAYRMNHGTVLEYDYVWKLFAYYYGHYVLDSLISLVANPVYCNVPNNVEQVFRDDFAATLTMQAGIGMKDLTNKPKLRLALGKLYMQLTAMKKENAGESAQNSLMSGIYMLVQNMPLELGTAARNKAFGHRPHLKADYEVSSQRELEITLQGDRMTLDSGAGMTFEKLIEENSATDAANRR